jgi:hypothetical protein
MTCKLRSFTNNTPLGLINIKNICDNSHKHCNEIVQTAIKSSIPITQEYFDNFLIMTGNSNYACCISAHYNINHSNIRKFILLNSFNLKINYWESIVVYMSDDELYQIIYNQKVLEPNIISRLVILDIIQKNGNRQPINFLNLLMSKIKSFGYLIMSMNLDEFSKYISIMTKSYSFTSYIDNILIKFIDNNKDNLKNTNNIHIGLKIIDTFITKPLIIKSVYSLISSLISLEQRQSIFDKTISTLDIDLLLLILENRDIILNITTINKLVEKSYIRPEGATNSKIIAEIMEILCEYGLVITKEIILTLLQHGCYINNFEKYGIVVDNEILAKCADLSYYPYKFDIVPNSDILKKECSKYDNLNTIRKLKEFGGIYTSECLEEACKQLKNGKVIKYLINECDVKITDKCLDIFQQTYKIDALDAIMKKYKSQNPDLKPVSNDVKSIEINEKSTMTIIPRDIIIDTQNNTTEYKLKNKIGKFFGYKKKTITINELQQIFLKYLITNKLVIGKYFVINIELSNLLKINQCVIMNIEEIFNILTYFIDL